MPYSLATIKKKIQSLQRKSWKLQLCETNKQTQKNIHLQSHFNGLPYLEIGDPWPLNTTTRKPLDFIFQIINNGEYGWPPNIKILQFFYDLHTQPSTWKQSGWYIRSYQQINQNKIQQLSLEKVPYTIQLTPQASLPSFESLDSYVPGIISQFQLINNNTPWDVYDTLVHETIGQTEITSFISGYPQWLQVDATPTFGNAQSELLIQVDSEAIAGIEWGRSGSLYLFYHPHKKNDYGFVLQSM